MTLVCNNALFADFRDYRFGVFGDTLKDLHGADDSGHADLIGVEFSACTEHSLGAASPAAQTAPVQIEDSAEAPTTAVLRDVDVRLVEIFLLRGFVGGKETAVLLAFFGRELLHIGAQALFQDVFGWVDSCDHVVFVGVHGQDRDQDVADEVEDDNDAANCADEGVETGAFPSKQCQIEISFK